MRVLHVIGALAEGSPDHQLRLLVRRLPHDSEVVTLSPSGVVAAALRADGTRVHELSTFRGHELAAVGLLRRLIRRGRFDLVHTHLHRAYVPGRLAARLAGVPLVVASEHHLARDAVAGHLYLAAERLGQATIAASQAIAGRLRIWGVPETRITVIPKAVDANEFRFDPALRATVRARLGIAPDVPVVGGVGRLEPGKRFAGAVDHTREMLCAMDVFASPCEETFGLVVLEAIAAGLPALYGACGPLEELAAARRAVGGARRLTRHDPESLPRALRAELLCLAERRGTRLPARTAGSRYDADRQAAAVGQVYERITGRLLRGLRRASA